MGTLHYDGAIKAKYEEEKQKRLRSDGLAQFTNLAESEQFKDFASDPWAPDETSLNGPKNADNHYKIVLIGAGYGSIVYAVHLIEAGFRPSDIVFLDRAKGFGGTWYWNRYPGLMCDVDSMVYLPFLEETGYMPKHKYSYGPEIREHANRIVTRWNLQNRAIFNVEVQSATWDHGAKEWAIKVREGEPDSVSLPYEIRSEFLILNPGNQTNPKLPAVPGIETFQGHSFHTARWDYTYTGGSPTDWTLDKLSNKKVAIIGTGATAIQVIPQVAKWAQTVYVVQRTPAGVDTRGQSPIDPLWWEEYSKSKGWQKDRVRNFLEVMSELPGNVDVDLVGDSWTGIETARALTGGPSLVDVTPENLEDFIRSIQDEDLIRTNRIRQRVDQIVRKQETAHSLKAWYHTWCKRPCFHDDYLATFNQANVHLVDTKGRGVDKITKNGIVAGETELDVDLIIFSTGFDFSGGVSPAQQARIPITGRNQLSLDDKWDKNLATLHGVLTRDFPNMALAVSTQSLLSPNRMVTIDVLGKHTAFILSAAAEKAAEQGASRFTVEPTGEAEQIWTERIMAQALPLALGADCTPSYYNREGELLRAIPKQERIRRSRGAFWMRGPVDFIRVIEDWEKNGGFREIDLVYL